MGRRLQRLVGEVVKFLTVGGLATLVAFVIFNGLVHGAAGMTRGPMHDQPLVAYVLANTVGMLVSYRGSRSWAFRHREAVGAAGGRVAFFGINIVSMTIPLLCLGISRYVLHLESGLADNVSANVIGLGLGTAARFWALRQFIFLHPETAAARNAAREASSRHSAGATQAVTEEATPAPGSRTPPAR